MAMAATAHVLLLATLPALFGYGAGGAEGEVVALTTGRAALTAAASAPVFAPRQQTTVHGVEGRGVTLACRVLQLGDKNVLWVRMRDLQILTHGGEVFTADARVSVPAPADRPAAATHTHALRIDPLRASDAGRYECQINTEPKMSLYFDLSVIDEAEADAVLESVTEEPWGEEEVEVWAEAARVAAARGGAAELACAARVRPGRGPLPGAAAPPLDIRWLRDGKPLTLQDGCAVSREAGAARAQSRLRLVRVSARDAAAYSCAVGRAAATIQLLVTEPESLGEMEAMQRDQSAGGAGGAGGASGASGAAPGTLRARTRAAAALLLLLRLVAI